MACTEIRPADRGPPQPGPWLWVLTGLVTTTAAVPLALADHRLDEQSQSLHALLLGGRVVLLLVGVLATGVAVARQARSALVLGLAALVAFTASHALDAEWDSVSVLFRIATMVALVAGIIVLLPQTGRRVLASLVLLFHFGGILTAVANVPPPGGDAPWLVSQLWSRVYRPYLQFMYLTNAYHFYAPDPGPPCFLWFHIEYADGSARWVKLPDRDRDAKDPFALQFYRRLPITESTNQLLPPMPAPDDVLRRRLTASVRDGIPAPSEISHVMPAVFQYRVPSDYSKRLLQSYARHAARAFPQPDGHTAVSGVKVYRVVHTILSPAAFAAGASLVDPTLYWPYFQGEFDRDGNLNDPNDPYLYWLIPIMKVATVETPLLGAPQPDPRSPAKPREQILDYVAAHASIRH